MVYYHDIGSHSMNRCNCIFESTVVNTSRILYNHAPWFCGTPFLLWWLALRHAWHCRQVFVASRALIREGYETRTKCWSTLFAHMAGFAMISTLLKIEPAHASPQTRSKDLWWIYGIMELCAIFLWNRWSQNQRIAWNRWIMIWLIDQIWSNDLMTVHTSIQKKDWILSILV